MRAFQPQILRSTIRTPQSRAAAITQHLHHNQRTTTRMASNTASDLKIENTNIQTAPGVTLTDSQKTLVGCVLDLFAGRPSLPKLQLWKDDAIFEDPITIAKGRKQYEPQWYGLQTAFSEIERLRHEVTSSGNPIEMTMETRYVVKGINQEKTIKSEVKILTDAEGKRIEKVEDRWDGKLPEGGIANVSLVPSVRACFAGR